MDNPKQEELRQLAEQYAKDFGIRYDKIRINSKGSITYRQSGSNSGGWQESGDSVNLPQWVITRHYELIQADREKRELEARIDELRTLHSTYIWNEAVADYMSERIEALQKGKYDE